MKGEKKNLFEKRFLILLFISFCHDIIPLKGYERLKSSEDIVFFVTLPEEVVRLASKQIKSIISSSCIINIIKCMLPYKAFTCQISRLYDRVSLKKWPLSVLEGALRTKGFVLLRYTSRKNF